MPGSMSGVVVGDDVKSSIENLIKKKSCQFVVFKLGAKDNKDVWEIAATGQRKCHDELGTDYTKFVEDYLKAEQAVFALYDFSDLKIEKVNLVAFQWCPDTLGVNKKMKFASSVDPLKKLCEASAKIFAKNEKDEVEIETVLKSYPNVTDAHLGQLKIGQSAQ